MRSAKRLTCADTTFLKGFWLPQGSWRRSSSKKFSSIVTRTSVGEALESGTIANCLPSGARSKFVNAVWSSRCLDHTRGLLASTVHGAKKGQRLETIPGTPHDICGVKRMQQLMTVSRRRRTGAEDVRARRAVISDGAIPSARTTLRPRRGSGRRTSVPVAAVPRKATSPSADRPTESSARAFPDH